MLAPKEQIKTWAKELGFLHVGIAKAEFLEEEAPRLETWLKNGYQGEMNYMNNWFDKRLDPRLLVDDAKSIIVLSYNYFPEKQQIEHTYKLAKYAYGKDYHFVIKDKLKELLSRMEEKYGQISGRGFVDSAPVLERAWAKKAGLGWTGKHTLLINKNNGSFFFLAVLITDLNLEADLAFQTDHCGTCTRCIDACPTEAILPGNILDASKCISYLTIEQKNEIPAEFQGKMDDWIFGCDVCQDVCPWNRFSQAHKEPAFEPHPALLDWKQEDWKEISEDIFKQVFQKSAIKRTGILGLRRNIAFLSDCQTKA